MTKAYFAVVPMDIRTKTESRISRRQDRRLKTVFFLLFFTYLLFVFSNPALATGQGPQGLETYGNAEPDTAIDASDLLRIRQNAGGYPDVPLLGNADASGHDCRLAVSDALLIRQYLLGLRSDLPGSIPPDCWAFSLTITNGDGQEGVTNQTLPQPLEVTLDNLPDCTQTVSGCTLGGATITYDILNDSTGGATLSGGVTSLDIDTDSSGKAGTLLTLGPNAGAVTVVASITLRSAEGTLLTTISAFFTEKALGVNITSPAAGVCLNTSETDVTVTTNIADGNTVTLSVNGSPATVNGGSPLPLILTSGGQATINNVDLPEGWVVLIASIFGANSVPVIIMADLTPPIVDVDQLASCYAVDSVTVSATCGDTGSGVDTCMVSIDEGNNWFASPHLYTGLTNGNYTAIGRAIDICGNIDFDWIQGGENFDVDTQPPTGLTATPAGGSYCPTTVSLTASDGKIYYTLDGSGPTTVSPLYTEPIYIGMDRTLKFMAVDDCNNQAGTVTELYTIYTTAPADPVADPPGGSYCAPMVSLSSTGATTIYYTTDGTDPTTASPVYTGPIDVNMDMTLKAIAAEDQCGNLSGIMTEFYTVHCGGDGTFAEAVNYNTVGTGPFDIAVGDFNSDGIQDLAVANRNGNNINIFLGKGSNGQGNGTFDTAVDYSGMSSPRGISVGDFNSDRIQDLAVTNYGNSSISILLGRGSNGKGDGTFSLTDLFSAGSTPWGISIGDFDSDGIQDLAVTNYASSTISILLGNGSNGKGDGTFEQAGNCTVGSSPIDISVGDFNSDGIQDLAVANYSSNNVSILRGNGSNGKGNGSFTLTGNFNAGSAPIAVSVGDFNSDGIQDLAVTNYSSDNVSILRGNGSNGQGNGSFTRIGNYPTGTTPWGVSVGDFNSDGIQDLAVVNFASNNVSILLGKGSNGQGNGTFDTPWNRSVGSSPIAISVGDFNSDGIQDLTVANYNSGNISILLGNGSNGQGNGSFSSAVSLPTGGRPFGIAVGDFNSDAIQDLAVANYSTNKVSIFLGNGSSGQGNGLFDAAVNYSTEGGPYGILVGDFNSDGIQDLAVTNYNFASVSILSGSGSNGQGNGLFSTLTGPFSVGTNPRDITVGDFNSDGIQDLAVANYGSNNVSILIGNGSNGKGNGSFSLTGNYSAGSGPMDILVGDFNSDAIQDLAVTNYNSGNVSILLGNGSNGQGTGSFTLYNNYSAGSGPWGISTGDFNSDAIQDMSVVNYGDNSVSIFSGSGSNGQGNGSFTSLTGPYDVETYPRDITVDDFNADGIEDLAVTNYNSDSVSILSGSGSNGQGNGSFTTLTGPFPTDSRPWFISVGDFNSDGIHDLAAGNYNSENVIILRGLGVY